MEMFLFTTFVVANWIRFANTQQDEHFVDNDGDDDGIHDEEKGDYVDDGNLAVK